jgi:hypothetical protein
MFRKRIKKTFPPDTFIATKPRVLCIIQLCIAFTAFLLIAAKPFMTEHYQTKSEMLLFEYVMGKQDSTRAELFKSLPIEKKDLIYSKYAPLVKKASTTFREKIIKSVDIILFEIPGFERAWIFFGILIPILLLKKVEGATQVIWLLPLITCCFVINNHFYGVNFHRESDKLFPSEEFLEANYIKTSLKSLTIFEQQKELLKAWQLFLVKNYSHYALIEGEITLQQQILRGDFFFNLARLEQSFLENERKLGEEKIPVGLGCVYILWNFLFAMSSLNLKKKKVLRLVTT